MNRRVLRSLACLILTLPLFASGQVSTEFVSSNYYILSMGQIAAEMDLLVQTLQDLDYTVIRFEGDEAAVYRGADLTTGVSVQGALADASLLVVEDDRFYLRTTADTFTYTVRPSITGYELVISPRENVVITDVLTTVLMALQEIGLLGDSVDLEYAAFAKNDLKGPPPPAGASIDSLLYRLVIAEDWFAFAAANALSVIGLRVDVVVEKLPGAALAEGFDAYAYEETEQLAQLLVPISRLVALASAASTGYVRPPYQPAVP